MLLFACYNLINVHHRQSFYNAMGCISTVCWFIYMLPQIIKNYVRKSTEGLSYAFVLISVVLSLCDVTSAYALGWNWPSLMGAPLTLLKKSWLLWQYHYYKNRGSVSVGLRFPVSSDKSVCP